MTFFTTAIRRDHPVSHARCVLRGHPHQRGAHLPVHTRPHNKNQLHIIITHFTYQIQATISPDLLAGKHRKISFFTPVHHATMFLIETKNPNPFPIGIKFGFFCSAGHQYIAVGLLIIPVPDRPFHPCHLSAKQYIPFCL